MRYTYLIAILIIAVIIYYFWNKRQENYADQVMHWYAGNIAGPVLDPRQIYGGYEIRDSVPEEKIKFMERESY